MANRDGNLTDRAKGLKDAAELLLQHYAMKG